MFASDWVWFWYQDCSIRWWKVVIMTQQNLRPGMCWKLFWAPLSYTQYVFYIRPLLVSQLNLVSFDSAFSSKVGVLLKATHFQISERNQELFSDRSAARKLLGQFPQNVPFSSFPPSFVFSLTSTIEGPWAECKHVFFALQSRKCKTLLWEYGLESKWLWADQLEKWIVSKL